MTIEHLLIANRGEIAIRIARAAGDLDIRTIVVYSEDDALSLHTRAGDQAAGLGGSGVAAYLDMEALIGIAGEHGCDAIHPGYGFLAENPRFARACAAAGLGFVGPTPEVLAVFGDKGEARRIARECGVTVLRGTDVDTSPEDARRFLAEADGRPMIVKAIAGGGGRGTRVVSREEELDAAWERCRSEAKAAFGDPSLYVEQFIRRARHIEVQVLGDEGGNIVHLGERDCSAQRRHQKIVEIAPAPALSPQLRDDICAAAVRLAAHVGYRSAGTFEFLLDMDDETFVFIEANARLQVEHTITEQVTGVDLVQAQLRLAGGESLADLGLAGPPVPRGTAIQARVNLEVIDAGGNVKPTSGTLRAYDVPSGPGVRVDGFGYTGYATSSRYDSLLAKVICSSDGTWETTARRCLRALAEFRIEGVETNLPFLQNVVAHGNFSSGQVTTRWIDEHVAELAGPAGQVPRFARDEAVPAGQGAGLAGAQIDRTDPLALFDYDRSVKANTSGAVQEAQPDLEGPDGSKGIPAPIQGTIIAVQVEAGDTVQAGQTLLIMEAMKMEHELKADRSGTVSKVSVAAGSVIAEGHPLVFILEGDVEQTLLAGADDIDPDYIRPDLAENIARHAYTLDENRPRAVERRRKTGQRTARENVADLCDDDSFIEYGPLVLAAQRRRRTEEWLRENTPADGMVCGVGSVNGDRFESDTERRCVALSYDYTVLAGTQGHKNHYKQDRMFELAHRYRLPLVLFSEGGGGRPGDTDTGGGIGMDVYTFTQFSKLSGWVPMVGVNSGRCFAGNTALLGCCDVIIATRGSTIAMGGPAMIEGGGLGIYTPEEVGPMSFQVPNGVVDILVDDDAAAVATAKRYIGYFQGSVPEWECGDQRRMRHLVPENRKRMYDVREVIDLLCDKDSVLEVRAGYGIGIITALVRIEGRPMGLIANNPHHLAGAIDSDGADKGARFLQLCDAFDLPVITLMDCPGIMVGPEVEKEALVRHSCRLFNTGANLSVPMFGVILRKAYGLGVQAMCGGSSMVPFFTVAWPTAEFAGMNIEGSIKLAYRNELAEIEDPAERLERYNKMVETAYDRAKAVNSASFFGVDDIIDPAETRAWISRGLKSLPPTPTRTGKKRPNIDTW